ncbi:MAG: acyl-CoA dehydrogenase family protein [Candidatus Melainabacteria bacterium]|jgi:alkylation response protein AidB-like acyl-CoA dehydrogenase|uniref:Acyl-CoA dehydrogenase family protein n=1 Tax=Candidatus Obscuribacter phosphatis TaxID=1906157 RepID=A0A8J7PMM5_9BACT|nr:acyl-CoA dehydrogenase family protein [Candidatus Obscuribacter phosphatis]MBX9941382.1 acyl-CoA dehydrogenase family protein [Candidatus Obscuribacterales bacterium]MCA0313984.1 acyl-CoA dehydrogenase family protein [Candidatus Melainabacteria bacterium]
MDFDFTPEQIAMRKHMREFAEREIVPKAQMNDRECKFDWDIAKKIFAEGFLGCPVPEKYGGLGMDYIAYGLMTEEVNRVCSSTRTLFSVQTSLVALTILKWGTEEQKKFYLPKLCSGEFIGCYGLTEPEAGSDAANQQTRAVKDGNDYILSGSKTWISCGTIAHYALIFATVDSSLGHKGITCFIVDTKSKGFTAQPIHGKLGLRASDTAALFLDEVRVPAENMLGQVGEGFKIAMSALDNGRFSVAAGAVGVVQGCIDACTKYAMERRTFGKPIGEHQQVQAMIADMVADAEAGRLLYLRAAHLKNKGVRNTRETSIAKLFCGEAANKHAHNAVQIFGGYGFSDEYPVERFFRDAKVLNIYEGTREIQRLIIGQDALGIRYANGKPVESVQALAMV